MTVTTIDPQTALIIVDLQKGIVALPGVQNLIAGVVENAALLADTFRNHGLPVVLANVAGGAPGRAEQGRNLGQHPADWAELIPELNRQPDDHLVTKRTWGAFTNTGLEDYLKNLGVTQVVVAGVATSIGVESTARQAHEAGFNITLAVDAMTDLNPEAHANSLVRIFPRLGETGTARQIVGLIANGK